MKMNTREQKCCPVEHRMLMACTGRGHEKVTFTRGAVLGIPQPYPPRARLSMLNVLRSVRCYDGGGGTALATIG